MKRDSYNGIADEYAQGATLAAIAKKRGVCAESIRKRLIAAGITLRPTTAHLWDERNPTRGKGHTAATKAKLRAANARQFSTPTAREKHALTTCQQIAEGRTGKAFNKLEQRVAKHLTAQGVDFIWQYPSGRFVFDFYVPATNTLIEVHGTFWHADPRFYSVTNLTPIQKRNVENDRKKAAHAKAKGYTLQVLWEADVPA